MINVILVVTLSFSFISSQDFSIVIVNKILLLSFKLLRERQNKRREYKVETGPQSVLLP